ncbi:thiamine ABC transporter substrate-binding protein [Rappaport israeli]|uniref:thiamine ABC transporter substrate-binding protein n=1 Tax=Rappaport israeli TaxID=1839807 RepID=UPI000A3E65AC|nr:thiamine ABC transporter substrate-binding protein [Rappaport israeli]
MNYKNTFATLALAISAITSAQAQTPLNVLTYGSFNSDWGPAPKLTELFEKQCDCTLNWLSAEDSVMMLRRLQLEGKALEADVIVGLDNQSISDTLNTGLIQTLQHPVETVFGSSTQAVPFDFGYLAFIKRKNNNLPEFDSLDALAKADNSLTIAIEDPRTSSVGSTMLAWVGTQTEHPKTFWQNIQPKLTAITTGWSEAYSLFTNGDVDLVLSYTTSPIYHQLANEHNDYEAILFNHPHYEQIEYAVALAHSPQSKLSEDFLHFLLTPEAQKTIALSNIMYPSTKENVDLPEAFTNAKRPQGVNLPPEEVAKQMPVWLETWKSALLTP